MLGHEPSRYSVLYMPSPFNREFILGEAWFQFDLFFTDLMRTNTTLRYQHFPPGPFGTFLESPRVPHGQWPLT